MSYRAPVKEMLFVVKELADIDGIAALPGHEDAGFDTAQAVVEEAARFCGEVLAPLNVDGDRNPSVWANGEVKTTPGFKDAFRQFAEGGWQGVVHPADFGIAKSVPATLKGDDPMANAAIIRRVLAGEPGPPRDIVLLNAGSALFIAGRAAPSSAIPAIMSRIGLAT